MPMFSGVSRTRARKGLPNFYSEFRRLHFLNCTKNTELTIAAFTRTFCLALIEKKRVGLAGKGKPVAANSQRRSFEELNIIQPKK